MNCKILTATGSFNKFSNKWKALLSRAFLFFEASCITTIMLYLCCVRLLADHFLVHAVLLLSRKFNHGIRRERSGKCFYYYTKPSSRRAHSDREAVEQQ